MMQFAPFEPEIVALMGRICDEAWRTIQARETFSSPADEQVVHGLLALRVMAAVITGEYDPVRLQAVALERIGRRPELEN